MIGAFVVVIGAAAIMMASASAFSGAKDFGNFTDALGPRSASATTSAP